MIRDVHGSLAHPEFLLAVGAADDGLRSLHRFVADEGPLARAAIARLADWVSRQFDTLKALVLRNA